MGPQNLLLYRFCNKGTALAGPQMQQKKQWALAPADHSQSTLPGFRPFSAVSKVVLSYKARAQSSFSAALLAGVLVAVCGGVVNAQATAPPAAAKTVKPPAEKQEKMPRSGDRRRAAKLFLAASKLFASERFEEALREYELAAKLDPTNRDYPLAADVARSHAVTALVQEAAKDRMRGEAAGARTALAHAMELDPRNPMVTQHIYELGDDALQSQVRPTYEEGARTVGALVDLEHSPSAHSFHLHTSARVVIQELFKAYGLEATVDQSVQSMPVRFDMDDASFEDATQTLAMATKTFYLGLDAHRVLVAADTKENRQEFTRQGLETVYLSGLNETEMKAVGDLAKNVFEAKQASVDTSAGTITLSAPEGTLNAFNTTLRGVLAGHNQVMLDVRLIQLAHTNERKSGVQQPNSMAVYNVDAEVSSILSANQSLIQQIIQSGLAAPGDVGAIIGILAASGQISNALFSGGFAQFGGSCELKAGTTCSPTSFALAPGAMTFNININSSDSKQLDDLKLHLSDDEKGTLKLGTRYPIQTSSFSSLGSSASTIAGLTGAGTSSALSSLASSLTSSVPNVPQIQYQDLGMTLAATPKVMRNNDVALTLELKIDALSGSSINGNPILNSRSYSGVVTLPEGQSVVVASNLDKQESKAISGMPGISEIPGLNNESENDIQKSYSTLLIVITPHVIRNTQVAGHTPMIRIDKGAVAR